MVGIGVADKRAVFVGRMVGTGSALLVVMNTAQLQAVRELAQAKQLSAYPVVISFEGPFIRGSLVGLNHEGKLGFCSEADAAEWVAGVNRSKSCDYRVASWRVVKTAG